MASIADLCRNFCRLNADQIDALAFHDGILQMVADLAQAQVTIYVRAGDGDCLGVVALARPNTSFIHYKPDMLGSRLSTAEEPVIWRTITTGEAIAGQREWAVGMETLAMQTFPLFDRQREVIAVVSFEFSVEDASAGDNSIIVETAQLLLTSPRTGVDETIYRPLSMRDGIMIADQLGQIVFANPAATSIYKILGIGKVVGRRVFERQMNIRLAQKAANTRLAQEAELEIGGIVLAQRAVPIVQLNRTVRTIVVIADITEIKKKEKELLVKSAVIQEIHHRVKNNLQTIASLLRLQARRTAYPEVKAALRESVNRILSISVVHEFLSQQDTESIDLAEVVSNILGLVTQSMVEPDFKIKTIFNRQNIILSSEQAINLAIVVNELILNSIEHGFAGRHHGTIRIDMAADEECYQIDIRDDGVGLPADFSQQNLNSLGLQIIRTLIEDDLKGEFRLSSDKGTYACIRVPWSKEGEWH